MALIVRDISNYSPDQHPLYFFDSNAWIAVLKNSGSKGLDAHDQSYINFFEAIIVLHAHKGTKNEKKVKNFPKVIVTSLLLSEIVNAFMRNVAMKSFYKAQNKDFKSFKYKEHYRKEPDHDIQLKKLISDFIAFKDYVELFDDQLREVDPYTILPLLNSESDFNDFYYYYLFYGKSIPIVTHDGDFRFQDIEIITAQSNLINQNSR